jgi:AcrR family transcriptional regulator
MSQRILDAAYDQVLTFGLRNLRIENLARRIGIARITIYRRFANKDELVRAAVLREGERLFARVDQAVAELPTLADQIVEGFVVVLMGVRNHPLVERVLNTEPEVALPVMTTQGAPVLALCRNYLAGFLLRAQQAGQVRRLIDVEPVAELIVRLTLSFVLTPESCIPLDSEAEARRFARRYLLPVIQPATAEAR